MLQTPTVVYCAVDSLIQSRGRIQPGFDDFTAALEQRNIPIVWVSNRTRLQMDEPRRKLGHNHPFIAEGGCGVYLPEGYFNLRPTKTVRMGRFTTIPIGEPQPAAAEALESISSDTSVSAVSMSSLSPRELVQNSGLPAKEAELVRHRDFDELFFFAGASNEDIDRFVSEAEKRKLQLRQRGGLWSLAVGADLKRGVRELSKLYDRSLRSHPISFGISTSEDDDHAVLFGACDRALQLSKGAEGAAESPSNARKIREISLAEPDSWEEVLAAITARN